MISGRKAAVIAAFIVLFALVAEAVARLIWMNQSFTESLVTPLDELYWRNRWISNRNQNPEIEGFYAFERYDETKGWISESGLRKQRVFEKKTLNTNKRGFRGRRDFTGKKQADKTRILILGDSFTFGEGVSDWETYATQLQRLLPQTEIINLGMHGYSQDQMLILLQEEGSRLQPDVVIVGFVYDNTERSLLEFSDFAKPRFVLGADGDITLTNSPVPTPESIIGWHWLHPRLLDFFEIAWTRAGFRYSVSHKWDKHHLTRAILREIADTIIETGAKPLFVFLPTGVEMADPPVADYHHSIFRWFQKELPQAKWISLLPAFRVRQDRGYKFSKEGTWRPPEHRFAALALRNQLRRLGLVKRSSANEGD